MQTVSNPVKNHLFPVFLKLEQLNTLLVGGGAVGLEKFKALIGNAPDARVTLVAPFVLPELKELVAQTAHCRILEREFVDSDLAGKDLAILATNDPAIHQHIQVLAKKEGILINVADTPELCDFYLGSIVQKGNLKIAISTNGKSPTTAKRLREVLQEYLPDEMDTVIGNLHLIRNRLQGNFAEKVKKMNAITAVMVNKEQEDKEARWKKIATYSILVFVVMLIGHFIFSFLPLQPMAERALNIARSLDRQFLIMVGTGFLAQLVDGALGMGYGVTSATVLLSVGVSPAAISGSIHTAETFASGVSGFSHYRFGNVNKKLFKALVIPGVLGAILGAILLTVFGQQENSWLRVLLAGYTLFLGIKFIWNAFRDQVRSRPFKHYGWLAAAGGFLDSFGGGGWGPLVTTTLINKGRSPKYVIGSVSLTEFFVTLASAFTFFTLLGVSHWQVIVALVIGGTVAAPLAARIAGKLPRKTAMFLLGLLVIFWSGRILLKLF